MRKADLARLLGVHMPQVDRLLDLRHRPKLEQVEAALNAVGYRIELAVRAA
jgi:antitoxin HicB